MSINETLLLG